MPRPLAVGLAVGVAWTRGIAWTPCDVRVVSCRGCEAGGVIAHAVLPGIAHDISRATARKKRPCLLDILVLTRWLVMAVPYSIPYFVMRYDSTC